MNSHDKVCMSKRTALTYAYLIKTKSEADVKEFEANISKHPEIRQTEKI